MYSGVAVKVSGIAYINKYGEVIKTSTEEGVQVTNKENVMVLLSVKDNYAGWYAPYNLRNKTDK